MLSRLSALMMMLIQVFLVAEYSGQLVFASFVSVLAVPICLLRPEFRVSPWVHVFLIGLGTTLCFYLNVAYPPEIQFDWILPGKYVVALAQAIILAQLFEFLFGHTTDSNAIRLQCLALFGFLVCFCRAEQPDNGLMFFWLAIAMGILLLLSSLSQDDGELHTPPRFSWFRWGVFLLALFAIPAGAGVTADAARNTLRMSRFFITDKTNEVVQSQYARVAYTASGDLSEVSQFKQVAPNEIALAVTCEVLPGYLRGRVFTDLTLRGWRARSSDTLRNRTLKQLTGERPERAFESDRFESLNLFELRPSRDQMREIRMDNSTNHIGSVFFTPLNSHYFEGEGASLVVDQSDVIRGGIPRNRSYLAHVPKTPQSVELDPRQLERLLKVPRVTRRRIQDLATRICQDGESDEEKMRLVEAWFGNNFEYSLEPFAAASADRISWFILNRPPAHCEYFASAAAVCLRLNGIPARYVTGFGVYRASESDANSGEMWVGLNRDAHAWVEAYDRQKKRWVVVEATPGVNLPKSTWSGVGGTATGGGTSVTRDDQDQVTSLGGWVNRKLSTLVAMVAEYRMFLNGLIITLSALLFGVVGYRRWRMARGKLIYQRRDLARNLRMWDRRLKKLGLTREPAETLHQFSSRLVNYQGKEAVWVQQAAEQYLQYATVRYCESK